MEQEELCNIRHEMTRALQIHKDTQLDVLAAAPIPWSGWECDRTAVLYRILPDGKPALHVLGGVDVTSGSLLHVWRSGSASTSRLPGKTAIFSIRREWNWPCRSSRVHRMCPPSQAMRRRDA